MDVIVMMTVKNRWEEHTWLFHLWKFDEEKKIFLYDCNELTLKIIVIILMLANLSLTSNIRNTDDNVEYATDKKYDPFIIHLLLETKVCKAFSFRGESATNN